jgi:hypothetical protein
MDITWQGSIQIDAPLDQVYNYLADFPRHCEWAQTLERMEQIRAGDSAGVGAQYLTTERQAMQADRRPREALTKGMRVKTICASRRSAKSASLRPTAASPGTRTQRQKPAGSMPISISSLPRRKKAARC